MAENGINTSDFEGKREEFRKYLQKTGVTEKLTLALMKLYQEESKPDDPIAFIRKQLCEECPTEEDVTEMQTKIETLAKEKKQVTMDLEVAKSQIKKTNSEADLIITQKYEALKADPDGNSLLKEYLAIDIFEKLKPLKTSFNGTLLDNIQSGLNHFDSEVGIFASDPNAYDTFEPLYSSVLEDLHDIEEGTQHTEIDWGDSHELEDLDPESNFIKSVRVMVARSLDNFVFMPLITVEKLEAIQEKIRNYVVKIDDEEFKGTYHELVNVDDEQMKKWIEEGKLFPEPNDKFLKAAETFRCWPKGRGLFMNDKNNFCVWVNEEEHLQVVSSDEGANLQAIYERLIKGMKFLSELEFAHHPRWGFLTHNLKNIGSTLRIIVKAKLPKLSLEDNSQKFETLLEGNHIKSKDLGDGYFELTNGKRVGITEIDAAKDFQKGIKEIITAEKCLYL